MKSIPIELLTHKQQPVTTLCRLLKLITKTGAIVGLAALDIDVTYDDNSGDGEVTYRAANGFTPSRFASAAGTGVDNAEMAGIIADDENLGITEQQIRAGVFDYAEAWCYEVNYEDLTPGRHEIIGRGTAGEVRMVGEEVVLEFRSLSQQLKQNTTQLTSLTCRERFGSMPIGTGGEQPESRYPCGKEWTWVDGTVTGVAIAEPDRIFTNSGDAADTDFNVPGVLRWKTGNNAGKQVEIEQNESGVYTLARPMYFPIEIGDEYESRQDCSKQHDDDAHGCRYHWGAEWTEHFRGEPLIPTNRQEELLTPGAGL